MQHTADDSPIRPMHARRITLADGRYMIFYTFGSDGSESDMNDDATRDAPANAPAPDDRNRTEPKEEPRV